MPWNDCGGLDLRALLAKALHMGDDGHNRLDAASLLYTTFTGPVDYQGGADTMLPPKWSDSWVEMR